MDIDVNVLGVDIEIKEVRHLLALRHKTLIDGHHGLAEIRMTHVAAIDKEKLLQPFLLSRLRLTHKTGDAAH